MKFRVTRAMCESCSWTFMQNNLNQSSWHNWHIHKWVSNVPFKFIGLRLTSETDRIGLTDSCILWLMATWCLSIHFLCPIKFYISLFFRAALSRIWSAEHNSIFWVKTQLLYYDIISIQSLTLKMEFLSGSAFLLFCKTDKLFPPPSQRKSRFPEFP